MGTFDNSTPPRLQLATWEEAERARSVAKTGGAGPVPYSPIPNPPDIYTHVGHDCNYRQTRRNGRTVRLLILHTTEADTFTGSMSYNARRSEQVSATAYLGQDGEIGYGVPEESVPWTTGRWNDESLALEICGHAAYTEAFWLSRPKQIRALIDLLTDWCRRHGVPPVWLTPGQVAEGASWQGSSPVQGRNRGVTDHLDANLAARLLGASTSSTTHHDIGAGLRTIVIRDVLPEVERRLSKPPLPPVPDPDPDKDVDVQIRFTTKNRTGQFLVGSGLPVLLTDDMVSQEPFKSIPRIVGTGADDDERWDDYHAIWSNLKRRDQS